MTATVSPVFCLGSFQTMVQGASTQAKFRSLRRQRQPGVKNSQNRLPKRKEFHGGNYDLMSFPLESGEYCSAQCQEMTQGQKNNQLIGFERNNSRPEIVPAPNGKTGNLTILRAKLGDLKRVLPQLISPPN